MKKSLIALSATTLGLVGSAAAVAAPANAALPADCATTADHTLSATATGAEDWYMDCTPLYGVGKAEFTISSGTDPFPADFLPLTDAAVASTATSTTSGAAVDAYTARPAGAPAGMTSLSSGASDATTQEYFGSVIVPVDRASLQRLDPATPPAACSAGTFNLAYRFDTLATTTTFTQVASGKTYTYNIVTPAVTNFLYLNATAGSFDDAPQCVTDGTLAGSLYAAGAADGTYARIVGSKATEFFGETLSPFGTTPPLPVFLNSAAVTPAAEPALAATGIDPQLTTLVGIASLAAGALALGYRRRRRTA